MKLLNSRIESKFEGLVFGVIASLYIFEICSESEAKDILWTVREELLRCHQMKRAEALDDPFGAAMMHHDFAEFALLCAKKRADRENKWKLLKYCEDHLPSAHSLTNPFKSGAWMESN